MAIEESSILPQFTSDGLLPEGAYELTIAQLRTSHLVLPPGDDRPRWATAWRRRLVDNAAILVGQLFRVGIREVFLGGSFVEDKDHPNDIDGYFPLDGGPARLMELLNELNELDPQGVWTWDPLKRTKYRGYPKAQLPMWHAYRVELYPHYGQPAGLDDRWGNPMDFPTAFRRARDGGPRGIIKIRGEHDSQRLGVPGSASPPRGR